MGERILNTVNIISGTNKCNLEGRDGRANTCPNNPLRSPEYHMPKICADCPTNPNIAASTKKVLPNNYATLRQQRYSSTKGTS